MLLFEKHQDLLSQMVDFESQLEIKYSSGWRENMVRLAEGVVGGLAIATVVHLSGHPINPMYGGFLAGFSIMLSDYSGLTKMLLARNEKTAALSKELGFSL